MRLRARGIENQQAYGEALFERLKSAPPALKKPAAAFLAQHKAYVAAENKAQAAKQARDRAIEAIGSADAALDLLVNRLADALVGAGLASRRTPFGGVSALTPSAVCSLAYKKEIAEVRAMVLRVVAKKPPTSVKSICSACMKQANAVDGALKGLTAPQNAYAKALAARDAILPDWQKTLSTLKRHAAVVFDGNVSSYRALFAPPEAMQAPVKRRRVPKAAATNGVPTSPAAS